jgi:hypothetical protein
MQAAWDALVHALGSTPPWLAAVLIGWALSAGLTQTVKFLFPLTWFSAMRELLTRLLAITSAAVSAAAAYIGLGGEGLAVTLVALGAGLWSPLAFALLQAALRRWAPWAADVLSGDVRSRA